jgi:hypothetical protein
VLELGPRGLAVAVRWQHAAQALLPGGVLAVNVCRGGLPDTRLVQNLILEAHLTIAGLHTAYAGQHPAVVHPDVVLPGASGRHLDDRPGLANPCTTPEPLLQTA